MISFDLRPHAASGPAGSTALRRWAALGALAAPALVVACGRESPAAPPPAEAQPAPAAAAPSPPGVVSRIERDGMIFTFELRATDEAGAGRPVAAGADATAVLTVTDAATSAPVRGLRPLAWMRVRGDDEAPDDDACRARIKSYMAGLLADVPDVDLNGYLLWTLNEDSSISVIDPRVAFSKTKLRHQISLSGRAADWALLPDKNRVYVTLRDRSAVAVVDARRSLALATVPVGERPARVVASPDGRTVWVGNDGDGTVSAVDVRAGRAVATLGVGPGHHEMAFSDEGRTLWVTSRDGAEVAAIDTALREVAARVEVGEGASSVASGGPSGVVYVANARTGEVLAIDPARRSVVGRVGLSPGIEKVAFEPSGRFAFALRPGEGEVTVIDASTGRAHSTLRGFRGPDELTFSSGFAYVRSRETSHVSLVDLRSLAGAPEPSVILVPVGQKPARSREDGMFASPFAPAPEPGAMVVASPADQALFYYVEGMMAPVGSFRGYGRRPAGVLAVDRRLEEIRPGVYATVARLERGGLHDVALLLDRPRVTACLPYDVATAPGEDAAAPPRLAVEPTFDARAVLPAGAPATLRFRLLDRASPEPIEPAAVSVLVAKLPGSWRWQGAPSRQENGEYAVTVTPPVPGMYRLLVAAPSRGAPLGALPPIALRVGEEEVPPVSERRTRIGGASSREAEAAAARYFTNTELVDQNGVTHRLHDDLLRGRKVLIHFAFTSCKGVCPVMAGNLAKVQELLGPRLGAEVVILTISVDPANDTPAVLRAFATRVGARPGWYFLTGVPANVNRVLRRLGGFTERPEEHSSVLLVGDARTGMWVKSMATALPEDIVHLLDHLNDEP